MYGLVDGFVRLGQAVDPSKSRARDGNELWVLSDDAAVRNRLDGWALGERQQ